MSKSYQPRRESYWTAASAQSSIFCVSTGSSTARWTVEMLRTGRRRARDLPERPMKTRCQRPERLPASAEAAAVTGVRRTLDRTRPCLDASVRFSGVAAANEWIDVDCGIPFFRGRCGQIRR